MDYTDEYVIQLSPGEADAILAHLGPPPASPTGLSRPEGTEENPVVIDGEEDEHPRTCGTLQRIRAATGEPGISTPGCLPNPLRRQPGGKNLHKPAQLVYLEKKLGLRLPKGPFRLSPRLARAAEQGKPAWSQLPAAPARPDHKPVDLRATAGESEDDPHPPDPEAPLIHTGEESEADPHHSPPPYSHIDFLTPWVPGASEDDPHPPAPRSPASPSGEKSEDDPHHSPFPSSPLPFLPPPASGASEDDPHPPASRAPLPISGEKSEDDPHHSPFPSLPSCPSSVPGSGERTAEPYPPTPGSPPDPFLSAPRPCPTPFGVESKAQRPSRANPQLGSPQPKRRRTRRAGRKTQVRRLLGQFYYTPDRPAIPRLGRRDPNNNVLPILTPKVRAVPRRLRITEDRVLRGHAIRLQKPPKWALIPLLAANVYPCAIPEEDPRYHTYIRKRAEALYPLPSGIPQ